MENIIQLQAAGDYAVPSGSFLVVEKGPDAGGAVVDVTEVVVDEQDTATAGGGEGDEDTPGFGVLSAVAAVLITTVVVFGRLNKRKPH